MTNVWNRQLDDACRLNYAGNWELQTRAHITVDFILEQSLMRLNISLIHTRIGLLNVSLLPSATV